MSKLRYDRELLRAETKDLKRMNKRKEQLLVRCQSELNDTKEQIFKIQSKDMFQHAATSKKSNKKIEQLEIELRSMKGSAGKMKTRVQTLLAVMLKPARGSVCFFWFTVVTIVSLCCGNSCKLFFFFFSSSFLLFFTFVF